MSRLTSLAVATLLALAGTASAASAASLSLTIPDAQQGSGDSPITYTGTADEPSTIENFAQIDGPPCPASPQQFQQEVASGARKTPGSRPGSPSITEAGAFRKTGSAPTSPVGRITICSWLLASSDGRITAAGSASYTVTAGPANTGCFAKTILPASFDVLNGVALQFYAKGGCANDDSLVVRGVTTITLRESDRKRFKLRSARILKGKMVPCGEGTRCVFFKFEKDVRKRLRAIQSKGGSLNASATVRFVMTSPFARTYTKLVRFDGRRVNFSCTSTNPSEPCRGDRRLGPYLVGEEAGGGEAPSGGR